MSVLLLSGLTACSGLDFFLLCSSESLHFLICKCVIQSSSENLDSLWCAFFTFLLFNIGKIYVLWCFVDNMLRILKSYLFLAMLGLHCSARAFSRYREQGLLSSFSARASHCSGFSCCGALGAWAAVAVVHGLSYPSACGIFPEQGSNLCPLHCKVDS